MIKDTLGNKNILNGHKTAFLCSRSCPASVVLRSYDWARQMRDQGRCVICGNHSPIEKDVVHYLLSGSQPLILALARGLKLRLEPELTEAIEKHRLLIITPFDSIIQRVTQATANQRNELIAELADEIFVAYAQPGGNLERLVRKWLQNKKKVGTFNVIENLGLIAAGAIGA